MDNDSKPASSGLPGSAVVVALLLGAGALFLREAPLEGSRPAANEPRLAQQYAEQDVDARLWQDPFGAVTRARQEAAKRATPAGVEQRHQSIDGLRAALGKRTTELPDAAPAQALASAVPPAMPPRVLVMAVMLRGGPYAEYVESRRRTRYAVLAGLNSRGYAPDDAEHIGYALPHDEVASATGMARRSLPEVVPFEWFNPPTDGRWGDGQHPPVLVLWLDDDAFAEQPLTRMKRLVEQLRPDELLPEQQPLWRVFGPFTSGGLRELVCETQAGASTACRLGGSVRAPTADGACPLCDASAARPFFSNVDLRYLSPLATAPDETLLAGVQLTGEEHRLSDHLARKGISLVRTIGDDRQLTRSLVDELERRGLKVTPSEPPSGGPGAKIKGYKKMCSVKAQDPASPSHVALIAEWDTLYARALRRQFDIEPENDRGFCVTRLSYVRGLDGQLPERGATSATAATPTAKEGNGTDDKARAKDGSLVERAEGQSQFDYLRRLAARLRERDIELRATSVDGAGIRAVGVLGNDVHDKLLVLRALRAEFPDAVFFTTDLDTRFLHPREQAWARNLIVASNFGLRLDDGLQAGAPPFRDGYQTSTYFTTLLAMDEVRTGKPFTQADLDYWLDMPRIFEIGRSAAFDFSEPAARDADGGGSCRSGDLLTCGDIHPPGSPRYPYLSPTALTLIASGLVFLLWFPPLALLRPLGWRRRLRRLTAPAADGHVRWRPYVALIGLLLLVQVALPWWLAVQGWPKLADWLTANGKPISLTEGISIWPTEAIHLLTLVLCLYLVLRGLAALTRNLDDITDALHLGRPRAELEAQQRHGELRLRPWQRLANMFSGRRLYSDASATGSGAATSDDHADLFWRRFIVQNRRSSRLTRTVVATLAALLVGGLLWAAFGESPGAPVRGDVSNRTQIVLAVLAVLLLNLLVFFVADATLFCVRFVRGLRRPQAAWPAATLAHFSARLGRVSPALTDHWIDLQFIARRTRSVTGLIYYPFIVLSVLLVSRSPFFDNWRLPSAALVGALTSVAIVLACVIALRRVAEHSRALALAAVDEALLRAHATPPPAAPGEGSADQLALLRRQIAALHEGAFAPFAQQPLLKALALPFATFGGTALLDYLALANV